MGFRCCLMLCVFLAGLAQSTQDYFGKAFQRAMPSPFTAPSPNGQVKPLIPPGFSSPQFLPKIIPQNRAFVIGSGDCAIPLAEAPITKDRKFLIRNLPNASSKSDPMAAPTIPACRE